MFYHKNEAFYINAELVSVMALVMQAMGESKIKRNVLLGLWEKKIRLIIGENIYTCEVQIRSSIPLFPMR